MELGKETEETFYAFEIDLSSNEAKTLREFGLKQIQKDDEALINYAVNYILSKKMGNTKKINDSLRKKIKKEKSKNGKSKSRR